MDRSNKSRLLILRESTFLEGLVNEVSQWLRNVITTDRKNINTDIVNTRDAGFKFSIVFATSEWMVPYKNSEEVGGD